MEAQIIKPQKRDKSIPNKYHHTVLAEIKTIQSEIKKGQMKIKEKP